MSKTGFFHLRQFLVKKRDENEKKIFIRFGSPTCRCRPWMTWTLMKGNDEVVSRQNISTWNRKEFERREIISTHLVVVEVAVASSVVAAVPAASSDAPVASCVEEAPAAALTSPESKTFTRKRINYRRIDWWNCFSYGLTTLSYLQEKFSYDLNKSQNKLSLGT